MPATSAKQKKLMDAAAHNPKFAKKVGVPVKVAKEYSEASKGQTFQKGGEMKQAMMKKSGMPMAMKDGKKVPAFAAKSGGMAPKKMAAGGSASKRADGIAKKGKTVGKMLASGGKC
jgi:hypothetical protein